MDNLLLLVALSLLFLAMAVTSIILIMRERKKLTAEQQAKLREIRKNLNRKPKYIAPWLTLIAFVFYANIAPHNTIHYAYISSILFVLALASLIWFTITVNKMVRRAGIPKQYMKKIYFYRLLFAVGIIGLMFTIAFLCSTLL